MNVWLKALLLLFGILFGFIILILIIGIIVTINEPSNQTIKETSNIQVTSNQQASSSLDENQQSQISQKQSTETLSPKNLKEIIIQGEDLPTEWKYNDIKILNESLQHPIQHYDISFNLLDNEQGISRSAIINYDWDTIAIIRHTLYTFSTKERTDEVYNNIINTIKEKRGYTEIPTGVSIESFGFYFSNENCEACATILIKKSNMISILFHGRLEGYLGTSFYYLGSKLVEDTNKNIEKRI